MIKLIKRFKKGLMNIAIFGGSFDPPHIGHQEIIQKAIAKLDIDMLFVVPTFLNPFKESFFAPAKVRYKWVKKMTQEYKKVKVLSYEIEQNHPVSTIETINYLLQNYDLEKIYLIIGADNVSTLHKWKDYEKLLRLVNFVVATREGIKIPKNLQKLDIHVTISSTKLREKIKKRYLPKSIADEILAYYNVRRKMNTRVEKIIQVLDDKKAENIQLFDMRGKDYFVEDVIIATTLGQKHGLALLDYLKKELKGSESHFDTEPSDEWSVVDLGDILIHIMTPEYRAKYNIEEFLTQRSQQN